MAKKSNPVAIFYGNMDWFDVEDEPSELPAEFSAARKLFAADRQRNIDAIIKMLQPFAGALFLPCNLPDWEEWFADPAGEGMPEIQAVSVKLVGVDFKKSGRKLFPVAKMEADFEVPMKSGFKQSEFQAWIDDNEICLHDALSFMWRIPDADATNGVACYTWANNDGAECMLKGK
jgi:hypothetical protein